VEFRIFDVRHGFCAALTDPESDYLTLIDCGHDGSNNFRPLQWIYGQGYRHINSLVISNFDQDHISDLTAVRDHFTVGALALNPTVNAATLRAIKIKGGSISDQMEILLKTMENQNLGTVDHVQHQTSKAKIDFYTVYYPHETDTNNLSLVTFIEFGNSKIVYPGDIEKSAWKKLLTLPGFIQELSGTNVFIASHHGRENGYCEDAFKYCKPEIVIISDQEKKYSTQDHNLYSKHVPVGLYVGKDLSSKQIRKVLTTRNDGHLTIFENDGISYIKLGL